MSGFSKNDSRHLFYFSQTNIFCKFDHISRTRNQINYRNIWLATVIIILIMTAQVLFFDIFFKKDPHVNAVESNLHLYLQVSWNFMCLVSLVLKIKLNTLIFMFLTTSETHIFSNGSLILLQLPLHLLIWTLYKIYGWKKM